MSIRRKGEFCLGADSEKKKIDEYIRQIDSS
jgi:hypothetical protein